MGLVGDETKYGNRDAEHSNRSYSTWMGYEIMGSVDDSEVEEDVVEVVRCKDCKHSHYLSGAKKYVCRHPLYTGGNKHKGNHFCSYGEKRRVEVADA